MRLSQIQKDFLYLLIFTVDGGKICYIVYMDINFSADIFSVTETELLEPKKYQVVFLNDDFTTKEFVTQVLEVIYHKNNQEAEFLMEKVHQEGSAVVGTYTYDIAATRVNLTIKVAREYGFPLRCEMREA